MATVKVNITGDASGLKSAVDESDGLLARLGRSFGGIGTAVATAGAAIGGLGVALGAKIGVDSVKAASDLEQSVGGVEAVFGSAADKVLEFGKTADKQFGMSANSVNQLTAPVGALLSGLGFTQDQAADTSIQLASLGADLAAAFGGTAEEAVSALGSTLRGEYDPAERFGVALSAAAVEAKAMEMGLADAKGELSAQAKAQATLALIMERTKNVQGQAGREADTFAGKTARLGATMENLKARIGEQLLPVASRLVGVISDKLVPAFEKFGPLIAAKIAPVIGELVGSFRALMAAFQSPEEGITSSGLPGFFERLGIVARKVFDFMREVIPPTFQLIARFVTGVVLPALSLLADWVAGTLIPTLSRLAGWVRDDLVPALVTIGKWINENVVPAVQAFAGWVRDNLIPAIAAFGEWVLSKLLPILRDLADWFNAKIKPALIDVRDAFMNDLLPALSEAWSWISDKLGPIMRWLAEEIAPKVWDHLQKIANIVMDYVVPAFIAIQKKVVEFVLELVQAGLKFGGFVVDAITDAGKFAFAVGEKIGEVIGFFLGLPERIKNTVGDLGSTLYNAGSELIGGLLNGIRDKLSAVWDEVSGIAGRIAELKGPLPYDAKVLIPNGRALMTGLATGIRQGLGEVNSLVGGIAPQMATAGVGAGGAAVGGNTYNVTVNGAVGDRQALIGWVREGIRQAERAQR